MYVTWFFATRTMDCFSAIRDYCDFRGNLSLRRLLCKLRGARMAGTKSQDSGLPMVTQRDTEASQRDTEIFYSLWNSV